MKKQNWQKRLFSLPSVDLPIGEKEKLEVVRAGKERRVTLNGVKRILQYDPACMRFSYGRQWVEIRGDGLCCTFYINGAVGVCGSVREIVFLGEEERY